MGGKNAAVVLADADLELAVEQVMLGAFRSAGQKCTATSRLVLDEGIAEEFLTELAIRVKGLEVGDPLLPTVAVGPVVSESAQANIQQSMRVAVADGPGSSRRPRVAGRCRWALRRSDGAGGIVTRGDAVVRGTVRPGACRASRIRRRGGVRVGKRGEYGLPAAVFTRDLTRALRAIDVLDVGVLHVNSESAGADPHVPFGGAKRSGYGPKEDRGPRVLHPHHERVPASEGGHRDYPGRTGRYRRRRLQPGAGRPVRDHDARRLRRRGHQDRTARQRRRHPGLGAAVRRGRSGDVLQFRQPQQAFSRTRPAQCGRGRASPGHRAALDVVVENFRAGTMERLGLGYQDLRAIRPDVIYCAITGFGSGEGAELAGYDLLVQAVGGLMSITDSEPGAPTKAAPRWPTSSPACTR